MIWNYSTTIRRKKKEKKKKREKEKKLEHNIAKKIISYFSTI